MPAKSASKNAAPKHAEPKHHEGKDLRRAYEHLGRVEILQRALQPANSKDIHALVRLAEQELAEGHRKEAADLLRAAEHFTFAVLADTESKSNGISPELVDIVTDEVQHLTRRASEHWDEYEEAERHSSISPLFHRSLKTAASALDAGLYRKALEFARGTEALAHVKKAGPDEPARDKPRLKLPRP